MIDHIAPALVKAILEGHPTADSCSFKLETNNRSTEWEASIVVGKSETCAARLFIGKGRTTRSAMAELAMNCIMDRSEPGQG